MRGLALALAFVAAGAGAVHTRLEWSRPAADETLDEAPLEIRLRFSTAIQLLLTRLELRAPSGALVPLGSPEWVPGSDEHEVRVAILEPLGSGLHQASWGSAGPDSHAIEGDFAFTVRATQSVAPTAAAQDSASVVTPLPGPAATTPPAAGRSAAPPWDPVGVAGRWMFLLGTMLMIGIVAFRWSVVAPSASRGETALAEAARRGLRGIGWAAILMALAGAGVRAYVQLASTRVGPAAVLFQSPWGWGWWLGVAAALLFGTGLQLATRTSTGRPGWLLASVGALAAGAAPALAGHAWGYEGALRPWVVVADVLHVLAAGTWMGSLAVLALVALPLLHRARDADGRVAVLPLWVAGFSRVALAAVAVMAISGGFNAWTRLGSFGALTASEYGRTLLIKLAVLAGAGALGFYNWRVVKPALSETPRTSLLRIPALLELALALGVLLVTSALVVSPLP
ncbi:MAG: CopD family protein [Gemmatimonadota bacterium]